MSTLNKVIVTCRLENGTDIDAVAKAEDRDFTARDLDQLRQRMNKLFTPHDEDVLFYKVRARSGVNGSVRQNWNKIKSREELDGVVAGLFKV